MKSKFTADQLKMISKIAKIEGLTVDQAASKILAEHLTKRAKSKSPAKHAPKAKAKRERKPRQTVEAPPPFDPMEVGLVTGCSGRDGMPDDEYGPTASVRQPWGRDVLGRPLLASDVLTLAVCQMTKRGVRFLLDGRCRMVFVITDAPLTEEDRRWMACRSSKVAGSYTEAQRMATAVRWIQIPVNCSVSFVAELAHDELELAYEEDPSLVARDVMFIVWKHRAHVCEGAPLKQLSEAIRDSTFTARDVKEASERTAPHAYRDGYDDDEQEPADWWKK